MTTKEQQHLERAAQVLETNIKITRPAPAALIGPGTHVIKTRQGEYRQKAFMGGEQFLFQSAYAGKKGKVILVFKPAMPTDFSFMEMSVDEARLKLAGWDRVIEDALNTADDDLITDTTQLAALEAQRAAEANAANPLYGSW